MAKCMKAECAADRRYLERYRDEYCRHAQHRGAYKDLYEAANRVLEMIQSGDWKLPEGFHETELAWLQTEVLRAKEILGKGSPRTA